MSLDKKIIIYIFIGVILGTLGGYLWGQKKTQAAKLAVLSQVKSIREKGTNYKFINPLLAYDTPDSQEFGEYAGLKNKLNDLIDTEKNHGLVDDVSIYFRGN